MTTISNNVQKKVNVIFWMRRFTSRRALECYVLFLSTIGLFSFVSVPHVIANMPKLTDIFSRSKLYAHSRHSHARGRATRPCSHGGIYRAHSF